MVRPERWFPVSIAAITPLLLHFCPGAAFSNELYVNVLPANTSDCLYKVASLPLREYEFLYDSMKGRRQLGAVGPELEEVIPESVEIHPKSTFPNPVKGQPPVTLENVVVIDKNVLFMHNVGATQELAKRYRTLKAQVDDLMVQDERMDIVVAEIEGRMAEESNAQVMERKRLLETEAEKERLNAEIERVKAEEQRKSAELEAEQQQKVMEQQGELARIQMVEEAESEKKQKEAILRLQEESGRRKEALRLETETELRRRMMEQEKEMDAARTQMDLERVKAEVEAKADAEKRNEGLRLQKIRAQGEEERKRIQEAINAIIGHLGSAIVGLIANPRRTCMVSAWLLGLLAGYVLLRESVQLLRQVRSVAMATRNAHKNRAPYRHLLLYGPPGTGKTMVAKRLAASSGMDCAVMSGGDVGPLGKDAVTEIHRLFKWAAKSSRGLLLFIDEAEAFLGRRSSHGMSEGTRNALNALLYNTGTPSHSFMMVLATNRAEDLDEAVLDRMDDSLLFPLPSKKACARLLVQYFRKYVKAAATSRASGSAGCRRQWWDWWRDKVPGLTVEGGVNDTFIAGLADLVVGFSGREIAKVMLAVQSYGYGSEDGVLTEDMVKRVMEEKTAEHLKKREMRHQEI